MQTTLEEKRKFLSYIHEGKIGKGDLKRLNRKQQTFYANTDTSLIFFKTVDDKPVYAYTEYIGEDGSKQSIKSFENNASALNFWYGVNEVEGKLIVTSILQFQVTPGTLIMEAEMNEHGEL